MRVLIIPAEPPPYSALAPPVIKLREPTEEELTLTPPPVPASGSCAEIPSMRYSVSYTRAPRICSPSVVRCTPACWASTSSTPFATSFPISLPVSVIAEDAFSRSTWFLRPTTVTALSISLCSCNSAVKFTGFLLVILMSLKRIGW